MDLGCPNGWSPGKIEAERIPEGCPLTFGPLKMDFFQLFSTLETSTSETERNQLQKHYDDINSNQHLEQFWKRRIFFFFYFLDPIFSDFVTLPLSGPHDSRRKEPLEPNLLLLHTFLHRAKYI